MQWNVVFGFPAAADVVTNVELNHKARNFTLFIHMQCIACIRTNAHSAEAKKCTVRTRTTTKQS